MLGGTLLPDPSSRVALALLLVAMGLLWFSLGVMACLKHLWAVYAGLALTYLSVLGQLLRFNICGIVILVIVILQGHRVIGWANRMRAAGVPLNTKP